MTDSDIVSVGRKPEPIAERSWAVSCGNSGIDWLQPNAGKEIVLNEPPVCGQVYQLRIWGNFLGAIGSEQLIRWMPADAAVNGFDESNAHKLEQIRFYTGKLVGFDHETKYLTFVPDRFTTPYELADFSPKHAPLKDALFARPCTSLQYGRLRWVGSNLEGDVSSDFLLVDSNLVMLDLMVWHDCHMWIGHATVNQAKLDSITFGN